MGELIDDPGLKGKKRVFPGREEAGKALADRLRGIVEPGGIILAIPAGGVPVGCAISRELSLPLDVLVVRKIQIPGNPEAGFGAIGPHGEVLLHERIVEDLRLSAREIKAQVAQTRRVLQRREKLFRRGRPFPDLANRQVVLVDDGLASGYTMLSAVDFVRQKDVGQVIVAVPTASQRTVTFLLPQVDLLVCPNIRGGPVFAVADAYGAWYDLDDVEVSGLLDGASLCGVVEGGAGGNGKKAG